MAALCLFFQARAQRLPPSTGLAIGDQVPDVTINNILNYPGGSARISDFKDKLLILDFWATWCMPCVAHLPEMFSIQNEFKEQVFVLLVSQKKNHDTEAGIKEFMSKRKQFYQFPSVVQDTVLDKLFKHSTIPHFAVIKNNRVVSITDAEHLNAANIRLLLANANAQLYVKKDGKLTAGIPLFTAGNGGAMPDKFFRSVLTGHITASNHPGGFERSDHGLITRIYAVNYSLENLYLLAYPEYSQFRQSRMLLNIPHLDSLLSDSTTGRHGAVRTFTYEASFPPVTKAKAMKYFRQDLERYFQLRVDSQAYDTTCFVLKLNKTHSPRRFSKGDKKVLNISEKVLIPKSSHGFDPSILASELEDVLGFPVFDETGFNEPVKVDLPPDLSNIAALTASLKKQGFDLIRAKRKVTYMTFSKNRNIP